MYFTLRVAELRKHQLHAAHVRCYAFCDAPLPSIAPPLPVAAGALDGAPAAAAADGTGAAVECFPLELDYPSAAANLLLSTPALVVHRLTDASPLLPPDERAAVGGGVAPPLPPPPIPACELLPALQCGRAPSAAGDSDAMERRLRAVRRHMFERRVEVHALIPKLAKLTKRSKLTSLWRLEVLVLIEGADSTTSSMVRACPIEHKACVNGARAPRKAQSARPLAFRRLFVPLSGRRKCRTLMLSARSTSTPQVQARHSYTAADVVWDASFVPCTRRAPGGGVAVDFAALHETRPLSAQQL